MRFAILILSVLILTIPMGHALFASTGEARVILRPEVPEGETVTIDRSMRISNVNEIPVIININPSAKLAKIINIIDNDFILQPNESTRAKFIITLKSGGRYEGKILVSFSPADSGSKEMGMGSSSTLIIIAEGPINEHYYEVIGQEDDEHSLDDRTVVGPPTADDLSNNETINITAERIDNNQNDEPNINVVQTENNGNNPAIGIMIIAGIVVLGIIIFFTFKKLK